MNHKRRKERRESWLQGIGNQNLSTAQTLLGYKGCFSEAAYCSQRAMDSLLTQIYSPSREKDKIVNEGTLLFLSQTLTSPPLHSACKVTISPSVFIHLVIYCIWKFRTRLIGSSLCTSVAIEESTEDLSSYFICWKQVSKGLKPDISGCREHYHLVFKPR